MKIRSGFVSNSSSSSFMILRRHLTRHQVYLIKNHIKSGKELDMFARDEDWWNISSDPKMIKGSTTMNNFSMREFLEKIGVPSDKIEWGD